MKLGTHMPDGERRKPLKWLLSVPYYLILTAEII
jgi:hypothetical protein